MKIALLIFAALIIVAVIAYFLSFPRNTFISFSRPNGGTVTFSRTGVSSEAAPTITPRMVSTTSSRMYPVCSCPQIISSSCRYSRPTAHAALGLSAKNGVVQAGLTVEWRQEAQRETEIRAFFGSLGITPSRDYLAGNGGVADATRILEYPISGSTADVTALTKRILQELCGVSPTEALDIKYTDK